MIFNFVTTNNTCCLNGEEVRTRSLEFLTTGHSALNG